MKKVILFAAVAAISFASCKKERDCVCTDTYTPVGGAAQVGSAETVTYKDVTKSQAKNNCISWTKTDASGNVSSSSCELK